MSGISDGPFSEKGESLGKWLIRNAGKVLLLFLFMPKESFSGLKCCSNILAFFPKWASDTTYKEKFLHSAL